jgi:hypothetical protein
VFVSFRWGTKVRGFVFNKPSSTSLPVPGVAYHKWSKSYLGYGKSYVRCYTTINNIARGLNFIPSSGKKLKQRVMSAKNSNEGRVIRRALVMLVKSTPMSPAYDSFVKAGREVNKSRRQKGKNNSRPYDVSMCIGKMMCAGIDTFDQLAMGACIPDGNVTASVRCFIKQQVNITIGTAGIGFCHFFTTLANNSVAFVHTTGSFTGTDTSWLSANNTEAPGIVVNSIPTPFDINDLVLSGGSKPNVSARIVAAGFSFRYTGKEVDKSGQAYVYTNPAHMSALSYADDDLGTDIPNTLGHLARNVETFIVETSREDTHVPLFPVSESELQYASGNDLVSGGSAGTAVIYPWSRGAFNQPNNFTYNKNGYNAGIATTTLFILESPGTTYTVNYGQHMEVVGQGVQAFSKIQSESDPVGVRDLMAASTHFQLNRRRVPGANVKAEFLRSISDVQAMRKVKYRG